MEGCPFSWVIVTSETLVQAGDIPKRRHSVHVHLHTCNWSENFGLKAVARTSCARMNCVHSFWEV